MAKYLGLVSSFFVFAFLIVFSPLLEVKDVTVDDDQKCLKNLNYNIDKDLVGKNLVFLNTQNLAQNLEVELTCIEKIEFEKKFPTQIAITIKAKSPVANIEGINLQVTANGLLVKKDDRQNLPTIFLPKDAQFDLKANNEIKDETILSAIKISENLLKSDFSPASIRIIQKDEIAVYSLKDMLVIFTSEKGLETQVNSLQLILSKAKIDAAKITKIDLRFDKPVITYQ